MKPHARMQATAACELLHEVSSPLRGAAARRRGGPPRGPGGLPARGRLPRAAEPVTTPIRTRRRRALSRIRPDGNAAVRA
jgi:hypothetical protein